MIEALFIEIVASFGGGDEAASQRAFATLARVHEGRAYHNLGHVESALKALMRLADDPDPRVVLALFLHDAVYDPRAADNEARSGRFAWDLLAPLGVGPDDLTEIERLILATKDHVATDAASALIVDADLAILAAPAKEYDRYADAIRREYAHVPDGAYRVGRTRVLAGLLGRKLFRSPLLDEDAARANIMREVEGLR